MINNRPTTLQQMGINITANFYVATGIARDGDWLPIPNGFQEHQCKYIISIRDSNVDNIPWDIQESGTHLHLKQVCYLDGRRVVALQKVYQGGGGTNSHTTREFPMAVNYLIVAIK